MKEKAQVIPFLYNTARRNREDRIKGLLDSYETSEKEGKKLLVSRMQVAEIMKDFVYESKNINWRHHDNGLTIDSIEDAK
jgi:hypothetical protein